MQITLFEYEPVTFRDPSENREVTVKMEVYSHDTYVPGFWQEFAIATSPCNKGCKVFRGGLVTLEGHPDSETPRLVLMHNSNYGCRR